MMDIWRYSDMRLQNPQKGHWGDWADVDIVSLDWTFHKEWMASWELTVCGTLPSCTFLFDTLSIPCLEAVRLHVAPNSERLTEVVMRFHNCIVQEKWSRDPIAAEIAESARLGALISVRFEIQSLEVVS